MQALGKHELYSAMLRTVFPVQVTLVAGTQLVRAGSGAGGLGRILPGIGFVVLVFAATIIKLITVDAAWNCAAILAVIGTVGIVMRLTRSEAALRLRLVRS